MVAIKKIFVNGLVANVVEVEIKSRMKEKTTVAPNFLLQTDPLQCLSCHKHVYLNQIFGQINVNNNWFTVLNSKITWKVKKTQ